MKIKLKSNQMKVLGLVLLVVFFLFTGCKKATIDNLLLKGKIVKAEKFCEELEGAEKIEGLKKVAAYYFRTDKYQKAALFYARAGDHGSVITCYLLAKDEVGAEEYCNRLEGETQKKCAAQLARSFYLSQGYGKAIRYYGLAGETQMVEHITAKIPAFIVLESLESKRGRGITEDSKMITIKETLKAYIYMEKYLEWRHGLETEPDKVAAEASRRALDMIEKVIAPALIRELNKIIDDSTLTEAEVKSLSFHQARMSGLIKLVRGMDKIAGYRGIFSSRFRLVYLTAIKHAGGLFETLEEVEKNREDMLWGDFKNNLEVDIEVIGYIASMLDNMKARLRDMERRIKNLRTGKKGEEVKAKAEQLTADFAAVCDAVLEAIGKEEYKKANLLLLSGYDSAKRELTLFEDSLKAVDAGGTTN